MRFRIVSVGKLTEPFYKAGVQEYLKRLQAYGKFELTDGLEVPLPPKAHEGDIEKVLSREAAKILGLIAEDEWVVALDIQARPMTSEAFAQKIGRWNESGRPRVNFVIGSSFGLDDSVKRRADEAVSFSPMTFPHQLAVLILSEQIYRGFRILRNEPYHK